MDRNPGASDSSPQNTSPAMDPAVIIQLSSEVSAQANMLATHQQQLAQLTTLTEEQVKTLQDLRLPASDPADFTSKPGTKYHVSK